MVAFAFARHSNENEPEYDGRPLHHWVELLGYGYVSESTFPQPYAAVEQTGANAIPFLLKWMAYKPFPLTPPIASFLRQSPVRKFWPIRNWLQALDRCDRRARGAIIAAQALGDGAYCMIPELARIAADNTAPSLNYQALACLESFGPKSLPALLSLATNAQAKVRISALISIAEFGADAAPALPILAQFLSDPNNNVAFLAGWTVGELGSWDPETVVSALIRALKDKRPGIRGVAVFWLGRLKEYSRSAMPALVEATNDPDSSVRLRATDILRETAPEVLTNGVAAQSSQGRCWAE